MKSLIEKLGAIVGSDNVLSSPDELLVYECDGLPQHKYRPQAVVFPSSTEQTKEVMQALAQAEVPFTPRGAGTGLSGGALALNEGVVIELARMRKILKIDVENRLAVVQPGVVNLQVSKAVAAFGLYYVPDPSSQPTCTIGGNIAENAGGIHCLKYGTTTDHVLGCRVVLAGGDVVDLGGAGIESEGLDLLGTFIGSEGTFGIVTEATLRLVQIPPAVRTLLAEFAEVNDASHAVSAIIAAGVMPAALEMMDHEIIRAVEASVFAAGLPPDAGAALLIELDGIEAGIDEEAERVTAICMEHRARNCRLARDEFERRKLWAARKGAFGAIGRISPDSMIQDAVVPRSRLPEVLSAAYQIAHKYELRIANVFHAGDGNLHPLICFDSRFPEQVKRVKEAGRELMEVCVASGGTITGEHGVGFDKRELLPLVFSDADMNAMLSVRGAFDPAGLLNPGKIIPMLRGCGEGRSARIDQTASIKTIEASDNGSWSESTSSVGAQQSQLQPASSGAENLRRDAVKASTFAIANGFDADSAASQLGEIVGGGNLSSLGASIVVSPSCTEQISQVLQLVSSKHWSVLPAGGMSWLPIQDSLAPNLIVSTNRLDKIIEHEPADLIAVAQAGVRLADFNDVLSQNGQWLPLDPPDDGRATVGGVVATGLGGAQQYGYGRPRGSVIGMRIVLANGSCIKVGGRVVKNVAGYDLSKLFTGSFGTLGIITEVNFKLRPRPASEATVAATGLRNELIGLGKSIIESGLFPVAVELVSASVAGDLGLDVKEGECALLARFAGNDKGVRYQTERALSLSKGEVTVHNDDSTLWRSLAALSLRGSASTVWRASVLPAKISSFVDAVADVVGEEFETGRWLLGIGDGRLTMVHETRRSPAETKNLLDTIRLTAHEAGANLFIEKTDAELMDRYPENLPTAKGRLEARVKEQLDPEGIFWKPFYLNLSEQAEARTLKSYPELRSRN